MQGKKYIGEEVWLTGGYRGSPCFVLEEGGQTPPERDEMGEEEKKVAREEEGADMQFVTDPDRSFW